MTDADKSVHASFHKELSDRIRNDVVLESFKEFFLSLPPDKKEQVAPYLERVNMWRMADIRTLLEAEKSSELT